MEPRPITGDLVLHASRAMTRPGAAEPPLTRVLSRAASDAVNLVVLGAFGITALLSGSIWLLAFGLATYAFLVTWKATGQECWQAVGDVLNEEGGRPRLPDPFHLADPLLRRCVSSLLVARSETVRLLRQGSPELRRRLSGLPAGLEWLEAWAASNLARIEELDRHLALAGRVSLQDEEERLGRLASSCTDRVTQREYEKARQVRVEHLATIDELCRVRARLVSTLQRAVAVMEAVPSQLMQLLLFDGADGGVPAPELDLELDHLRAEMQLAEECSDVGLGLRRPFQPALG